MVYPFLQFILDGAIPGRGRRSSIWSYRWSYLRIIFDCYCERVFYVKILNALSFLKLRGREMTKIPLTFRGGWCVVRSPQRGTRRQRDRVHGGPGLLGNPDALRGGKAMAASSTRPAPHDMKPSINQSPIMFEVSPARIPEEPGAVIPHAGICEGGVGKPTSLP
jgi:hypothetical protein